LSTFIHLAGGRKTQRHFTFDRHRKS